jgi:hypothetical protein
MAKCQLRSRLGSLVIRLIGSPTGPTSSQSLGDYGGDRRTKVSMSQDRSTSDQQLCRCQKVFQIRSLCECAGIVVSSPCTRLLGLSTDKLLLICLSVSS